VAVDFDYLVGLLPSKDFYIIWLSNLLTIYIYIYMSVPYEGYSRYASWALNWILHLHHINPKYWFGNCIYFHHIQINLFSIFRHFDDIFRLILCVCLRKVVSITYCVVFLLCFSSSCVALCCLFLWIVNFSVPLRYSLTFI
jgi:hypothetical protein